MPIEEGLDPEVVSEMKGILDEHVDKKLVQFRGETERRIKEMSARGLGILSGVSAPATRSHPLLATDQKFADFARTGRGRWSKYTANYADFHIEQKVAGLIVSPGINTVIPGFVGGPEMGLRLTELLPVVSLSSGGGVEYGRENVFTPGAAIQAAEGDVKATTDIAFETKTATVKTIATICKASLQALADTPGVAQWIDARLRYAVQLKAEDYLLNAAAPDGLMAAAGALNAGFDPGTGATQLDVISAAIGQLASAGFVADGIVLSAADANKTRLLKDSTGRYIWASPNGSAGMSSMWTLPVVLAPSMPAGSWLVGAFGQSCILFSRQMLVVDIAYENEDDFIRNLACFRAEERIAQAILIPSGLLKGTFTAAGVEAARSGNAVKK